MKETKPRGSNAHKASNPKPPRPPVDGDAGFSNSVHEMKMRLWHLRDNPDVSQRITHERAGLVKFKPE
jgi:hypothetical protein